MSANNSREAERQRRQEEARRQQEQRRAEAQRSEQERQAEMARRQEERKAEMARRQEERRAEAALRQEEMRQKRDEHKRQRQHQERWRDIERTSDKLGEEMKRALNNMMQKLSQLELDDEAKEKIVEELEKGLVYDGDHKILKVAAKDPVVRKYYNAINDKVLARLK